MDIEELLYSRLEYCLMKQKRKKYRSAFYNYKVKQYSFLISMFKMAAKEAFIHHCDDGYKILLDETEEDLMIIDMRRQDILYTREYERDELIMPLDFWPEETKEYEIAKYKLAEFDANLQRQEEELNQKEAKANAAIKAIKWLQDLTAFYIASQYDIYFAKKWDKYCECGEI